MHRHGILLLQAVGEGAGFRILGVGAVEHHDEGLAQRLQLAHGALLRRFVGLAGQLYDAAVGGHNHADGGVLRDHLARAHLGGLLEGNVVLKPGRAHHALVFALLGPQRAGHQVAHAVHQPHAGAGRVLQPQLHRLVGHELRLGRHHGLARAALGQFIPGALAAVFILHVRQHHQLHEPLDEARLARADRADDADVDVAVTSARDIPVDRILIHGTRLPMLLHINLMTPVPRLCSRAHLHFPAERSIIIASNCIGGTHEGKRQTQGRFPEPSASEERRTISDLVHLRGADDRLRGLHDRLAGAQNAH